MITASPPRSSLYFKVSRLATLIPSVALILVKRTIFTDSGDEDMGIWGALCLPQLRDQAGAGFR